MPATVKRMNEHNIGLAKRLISRLQARGLTVGTAESCTGGNIAHCITAVPGSSAVYPGGVVSYANHVKEGVLGVSRNDLERCGAVSEAVVKAMAQGVRQVVAAQCSMATSGIAGPGGGTAEKPVGTVWMACAGPWGVKAQCCHFAGERDEVIAKATGAVLQMLLDLLIGWNGPEELVAP